MDEDLEAFLKRRMDEKEGIVRPPPPLSPPPPPPLSPPPPPPLSPPPPPSQTNYVPYIVGAAILISAAIFFGLKTLSPAPAPPEPPYDILKPGVQPPSFAKKTIIEFSRGVEKAFYSYAPHESIITCITYLPASRIHILSAGNGDTILRRKGDSGEPFQVIIYTWPKTTTNPC